MADIYLIGSLCNPAIPVIGRRLRQEGFTVFDDWFAAGPDADLAWMRYEKARGNTMAAALPGVAAQHVFQFDWKHLNEARIAVLVLPAGRSGHLELGFMIGKGKPGYVLYPEEPDKWDVMYNFAQGVFTTEEGLIRALQQHKGMRNDGSAHPKVAYTTLNGETTYV